MPDSFNIERVLVAPLDWGLGHATRCIPIIRALIKNGYQVLIAAEGAQEQLLRSEFPNQNIVPLRGYRVSYSKRKRWLALKLLLQLPRLLQTIRYEQRWLQKIIETYSIGLVISDNRFGLYTSKAPCVFITHQLTIKAPYHWLELLMRKLNYNYINRFSACWVPDAAGLNNIAGSLSHPPRLPEIPVQYIGLLARFNNDTAVKKYDYCILLSGPEPQRSMLEAYIIKELPALKGRILLVRGKPGVKEKPVMPASVTIENHLSTGELGAAVLQSEFIICRSGYTTVMELLVLQKKMILIPTPGQTEQEYLAAYLQQKKYAFSVGQHDFDLSAAIKGALAFDYEMPALQRFEEENITAILAAALKVPDTN